MGRFTPPYLGVAYYPEVWPQEQLDEDIRLMLEAGLNAVRIAEFAWSSGRIPPCQFYESSQIPNSQNNWLGANIAGYNNQQYDAACQAARQTRPDDAENYQQRYAEVQRLFAEELPVIPLFFRVRAVAARPDFCGLEMDTTARSNLWNIEAFDYGEGCQ